jgi:DNA-binding XRE family transcriptional regulator
LPKAKKTGVRVYVVEVPDVRAIRQRLHMSQRRFAETYRIPLPTLKNWEQGRRSPDARAAAPPTCDRSRGNPRLSKKLCNTDRELCPRPGIR